MISILNLAKRHILGLSSATAFLLLLLPVQLNAQSLLQNSGGALQPQSGQTQKTNDYRSQTSSPQTGENQSLLNSRGGQSLGVVSDPKQSSPDAVVQPSSEIHANNSRLMSNDSSVTKYLAGFVVVFLLAVFIAYRFSKLDLKTEPASEPLDRGQLADSLRNPVAELAPVKNKKTKKKRRKPHQR
jgi:hypothetical protein